MKLRIGLDFDDVLIASADHTIKIQNQLYGTSVVRDDWYDTDAVVPWGVATFPDVSARVIAIHQMPEFLEVEPLQDAQEVLRKLKKDGHELIVITGRPPKTASATRALLTKYYSDSLSPDDLRFTDYFSHEGAKLSKGDIAVELGLTHFVDDVIPHANDIASRGVTTVLFGEGYKWNQAEPDNGVIRLGTWKAVGEFFGKEAERLRLQ